MGLPLLPHRKKVRLSGKDYSQAGGYYITIVTQGRECLFGEIRKDEMLLNAGGNMLVKWWNELANKFPSVTPDIFVIMPNHLHGIIILHEIVGADLRVGPSETGAYPSLLGKYAVGADLRVGPPETGTHPTAMDAHAVGADLCVGPSETGTPTVGADLCVGPPETGTHPTAMDAHAVGADLCVGPGDEGAHIKMGEHIGSPLPNNRIPLPRIMQWFKTMTTNEYIRGVKQYHWPPFAGKLWQRNYYEHIIRNEKDYERIFNYIQSNPSNWAEDEENR
jgi:REP-associated tyrosine transposase